MSAKPKPRPGRRGNKHAKGKSTGRPPSYDPRNEKIVYGFILLTNGNDTTDAQIAARFNVTEGAIRQWKWRHPKFGEAIRRAKEQDEHVAVSLGRRAKGYTHRSEEIFFNKDGLCILCTERLAQGEKPDKGCYICGGAVKGTTTRVPTVKKYPPDVKACLAILRRMNKSWQQTRAIEFSGPDGKPVEINLDSIDVEDLSAETLEMIARDVRERVRKKREEKE